MGQLTSFSSHYHESTEPLKVRFSNISFKLQMEQRTSTLPPPYPVWQAERHVSTKGLSALTSKVGRNELEKARRCKYAYCVITYVFLQNGVPIRNSAPWARGSPVSCERVLPGRTVVPMLTVPSAQLPAARDSIFLIPTCCPASHRVWRTEGSSECQPKGMWHPLKECGTHSQW